MPAISWSFWILAAVALAALTYSMVGMPGRSAAAKAVNLGADETPRRDRLRVTVEGLAGAIGERNLYTPEHLEEAARYIESGFREAGYETTPGPFAVGGATVRNIEAVREGSRKRDEIVVVGAHYDSVSGSPGANDNASGVAALLEIARAFADRQPARSIRFVAFVNEEPPYFQTDNMGSLVYASEARRSSDDIVAMLSLETIGYYSDRPDSQKYPLPFSLFYPDRGNFIGFVGNLSSRHLVRRCVAAFRRHSDFPSEGASPPGWITGVGWSDHWAFWQHGYAALMVTDTAPFRYAHYHGTGDTPDKLDYDRMTRVVSGLIEVVAELADT